jgi:hypothetical protein
VSHNATVIPIKGRKLMSVSYYHGGVSVAKAKRWSHSNPQTQEAWQAP